MSGSASTRPSLGYHLEQACRLRGRTWARPTRPTPSGPAAARPGWPGLGDGPGTRATTAPRPASWSGRPTCSPPDDAGRAELLVELGRALRGVGELARAEAVLSEAVDATVAREDRVPPGSSPPRAHARPHADRPPMVAAEELALAWVPVFTERA